MFVKNRNRRLRGTSDGTVTLEAWNTLKESYGYRCPCCGRSEPEIKLTIDHIVPVTLGGKHTIGNIQPLCHGCNSGKKNRHPTRYELFVTGDTKSGYGAAYGAAYAS